MTLDDQLLRRAQMALVDLTRLCSEPDETEAAMGVTAVTGRSMDVLP
jgi:hypothetical protein